MYFLITRPLTDKQNLAENLPSALTPIFQPMLEITFPDIKAELAELRLRGCEGIIFTSGNGVRAVQDFQQLYHLPVFTVGEKTAALARSTGFTKVISLGANVEEATGYLVVEKSKLPVSLIYFRGDKVTTDLKAELTDFGYNIQEVVVYKAEDAEDFSPTLLTLYNNNQLNAASFYSQATAQNYIRLATRYNLKENHSKIEAFALSEQIAQILKQMQWHKIHVAKSPTEKKMLELVLSRYEEK